MNPYIHTEYVMLFFLLLLRTPDTALSRPSFWALLVLPHSLDFSMRSLPTLQVISLKSSPTIDLLELLVP